GKPHALAAALPFSGVEPSTPATGRPKRRRASRCTGAMKPVPTMAVPRCVTLDLLRWNVQELGYRISHHALEWGGQGHRGILAAFEEGRVGWDVAGAVVTVTSDAHERVFLQLLSLQLVLDEGLARQVKDLGDAEIETGEINGPFDSFQPGQQECRVATAGLALLRVGQDAAGFLFAKRFLAARRQLDGFYA